MKKIYLLAMLCIWFSSCIDENVMDDQSNNLAPNSLRPSGDGVYDVLGMGYDVMGEYLHPLSVKNPVLDIPKYKAAFAGRLITGTPSWGKDQVFYGYNSIDYLSDITKETNAGLKLTSPLKLFTGNISGNSYLKSVQSYSSKYSFASVEAVRNYKYIRINDEISRLRNYLSKEFVEDLNRLTPDRLVERYGTHVLTDFVIGGRYKLMFRSIIENTGDVTSRKNTVAAGLGATLSKIGFSLNADRTITSNESLAIENREKELYVMFYGGNGTNLVYDLEKGSPTAVDVKSWEATVKLKNSNLTSLNWNETYPIYEFISDATKKAQVKAAVEKHIASKQITVMPLKGLYRMYNDWGHFHHTIGPWVNVGGRQNEWRNEGTICFVFEKAEPGYNLKPLYLIKNTKGLFYLSESNERGSQGIHCYVYRTQVEGTQPLHKIYHSKDVNHIYTIDNLKLNEITQVWKGWTNQNVIGYVYPGVSK